MRGWCIGGMGWFCFCMSEKGRKSRNSRKHRNHRNPVHWCFMKSYILGSMVAAALVVTGWGKSANGFAGRWDLTMNAPNGSYPDWLEVTEKDGGLQARFQPRGGSVRPIEKAEMAGDHL